jgi:hypothetical protein
VDIYASDTDPAGAAGARLIWLARQRRVHDGWQHAPGVPPLRREFRNLDGPAALAQLEMRAWLEMTAAAGAVLDVEIDHRIAP